MRHLEALFRAVGVSFDCNGNRVRYCYFFARLPHAQRKLCRCFLHVINLAVQAIYATLKNESNADTQYLLGNLPELTEEALQAMPLPDGVTIEGYRAALTADIVGTARKLVTACRSSGLRREEFELTIREGNDAGSWMDSEGKALLLPVMELLRDCEIRWSSTFLMLDRILALLLVRTLWLCQKLFSYSLQAIEAFAIRPKQVDGGVPSLVPNKAEVCVVKHIHEVVEIPHLAQELLSTDQTPTLAFSLPIYDKIIHQWESKKQQYPLLAPSIQVGTAKLKEYIAKT